MNHVTSRVCLLILCACQIVACNRQNEIAATRDLNIAGIDYIEQAGWRNYGSSLRGDRFAADVNITPGNVNKLEQAWVFQTGDATSGDDYFGNASSFKATPIVYNNTLYFSTGFNRVFAIDAVTGIELWRYDPQVNFDIEYSEMFTSRGVSLWVASGQSQLITCTARIFLGTLDARLIAMDAITGQVCQDFANNGEVDLTLGIKRVRRGEYSITSPPTVIGDLVVVGSSIGDNGRADLEEGLVRAYDVRTGELRWRFDPIPRQAKAPGGKTWTAKARRTTGGANVWSVMAADTQRDLIYLPTTSPSPDFYGGERIGDNSYANSIVALRASTGAFVWGYQLVRHDLWDYDLASQPLLIDLKIDSSTRPALAVASKMGFVFVLDRETGEPLHPVEERKVPASAVPGEVAAGTQRFPAIRLHPTASSELRLWHRDDEHVAACNAMLEGMVYEGIFTPPSLQGTLLYPGNTGGMNWGSMAASQQSGIGLAVVNRWPTVVKLIPRSEFSIAKRLGVLQGVEAEFTAQNGTPYGMARFEVYNRQNGLPCLEGPWSTLVAVDLATAETLWEVPVGQPESLKADPEAKLWGYFARSGPMVTAGGVAFLATPYDYRLSAFDLYSGKPLWSDLLPAQPGATPMSYHAKGADYVVVAAGGKLSRGDGRGDYLIAYRLQND